MTLQNLFIQTTSHYNANKELILNQWQEIELHYTNSKREYHNLSHLEYMIEELAPFQLIINDWNTILVSIFYHDIIYNPQRKDNEEKSALFAEEKLTLLSYPKEKISKCKGQILATKTHNAFLDNDVNFLTDADLTILGADWETYYIYTKNIRSEYYMYPDKIYSIGRKGILTHFLEMKRIFKTEAFYKLYEKQARKNIQQELINL